MKKGLLLALSLFILNLTGLHAQSSCPVIVRNSIHLVTSGDNACMKAVSFDFINPSNGAKRINLTVKLNTIEVINICIDASGQNNIQRNYTSSQFAACSITSVEIIITPFSGSNCNSSGCAATSMNINSAGLAILPVTFSSFAAARINNSTVLLKWATVTEINSRGFAIERNNNGNWEQVGYVFSQAINGNSNGLLTYQFTDINTTKGISQYRIKQTDIDDKAKYSDVRAIQGEQQGGRTVVFPNPATDGKVNILFPDTAPRDIIIADMTGRTIKQYRSYQDNSLQVTNLTTGMYMVRSMDLEKGTSSIEKIMIN